MPSEPAPLDDGDRRLMHQCPFRQFVPNRNHNRALAARLKRIRSLTIQGRLHGKVLDRISDGYNCEVTLTNAGRVALGWPPINPPDVP